MRPFERLRMRPSAKWLEATPPFTLIAVPADCMRKFMGKLDDVLCRLFGYRCPLTVELDGDSLLHGYGVPVTPVQRIQAARPRWRLDDRTANGLRMETAIQTFPSEPHTARIIVIALGANDAFGMVPAATYRADLEKAVSVVCAAGARPVFTGLARMPADRFPAEWIANWEALNAVMHDIAQREGIEHAGWDADYRGEQDLQPDFVHRSQEASDRFAELLVAAIERAR
ncbi:SGNH/GDSL hydrolase family protein [Paracidovorax cattleyae]|uniref:SGNH/GDSL hydrolase family protein n=1 Tax=Paracidovorax cattleyae TaxID=80868 RepID=UPI00336AE3D5